MKREKASSVLLPRSATPAVAEGLNKTVLVVEDDSTHRVFMEEILENCGFAVVPAENGLAALTRLAAGRGFDLILMDWDMPEMDGLETVRNIRAREIREGWPHIPVVAFTAHNRPGDREQCLAAGMDAYLPKEVWMPKWRQTLIDNLQGLISGTFTAQDFEDSVPDGPERAAAQDFDIGAFDEAALADSRRILKSHFRATIEDFLEDAGRYVNDIGAGLHAGDRDKVARSAHPLKSASRGLGLIAVSGIARAVENAAREGGDIEMIKRLHVQLRRALAKGGEKLRRAAGGDGG